MVDSVITHTVPEESRFSNACQYSKTIIDLASPYGTENKLNYHVNLRSQLRFDLKQPSILIRSKEPEESTLTIKVYAGDLRYV
ncbi:unnamed protein product [Trichobilharzia regenti]|nr:unnamed protein product [Trichobilharzia regenti]